MNTYLNWETMDLMDNTESIQETNIARGCLYMMRYYADEEIYIKRLKQYNINRIKGVLLYDDNKIKK